MSERTMDGLLRATQPSFAGDSLADVRLDQSNVARSDAHPLVGYDDVVALAPDLLAAARYLLKDDAEARDLVQATLEIGIRKIDQLRDPSRLRPWLFAIETREAFRLRRRLARYLVSRPSVGTLASSDHHEETFVVREAVSRLPVRMQGAVVLHHLVGLTVTETAAAMGITQNTAKTLLRLGFARLREDLK